MPVVRLVLILLMAGVCQAQEAAKQALTAEAIMAHVAVNQDRSEKLRAEYVYKQRIRVVTRKTNGRLMWDETTDYRVVPTPGGTKKELERITGRYAEKGKYVDFTSEPAGKRGALDGDLAQDLRNDLSNDKSKDGLGRDLFPLTTEQQNKYQFRLIGEETQQGRPAYRIAFRPKDKDDLLWAGEALIDQEDFQPVVVFTKLSRRIPFAVRTFLGTDLPGVGFNVKYQRQADGVWFPVSFGAEFRLHVLFFINRDISVALQNTGFQHTEVKSTIKYEGPPPDLNQSPGLFTTDARR
jgi:hypothetical protein